MTYLLPGAINLIGQLPTRPGAAPYPLRQASVIKAVCIHYVGGDGAHGYGDVSPQQTAAYQTGPKEGDQFPEIAYHVYITRDGTVYQCHDLLTRTWHAGATANDEGIAVCLAGYGYLGYPSRAQVVAAAGVVNDVERWLGRGLYVKHHGDYMQTDCCGQYRTRIVAEVIEAMETGQKPVDVDAIRGQCDGLWTAHEDLALLAAALDSRKLRDIDGAVFAAMVEIKRAAGIT
jgi:hypothetical protein